MKQLQLQTNEHYTIMRVELPAGKNMPRHFATSDAYVIVESGNALLICKDEIAELTAGSHVSIPAFEPHVLRVIDDFRAFIVLAGNAIINYPAA